MELYDGYAKKLKQIAFAEFDKGNREKTMAALSAYADLSYHWNQFYTDDEAERLIERIAERYAASARDGYEGDRRTVLFYDGFGLDTRGLALIYAKALAALPYRLVWVTDKRAEGRLPQTMDALAAGDSTVEYVDMAGTYMGEADALHVVFQKYHPSKAFFYTTPGDVSAMAVFAAYQNMVERFLINLTDHAFWLGKCAMDVCVEFREYGAGISKGYRGISPDRLRLLPYYPWIDTAADFAGFPFEPQGKKIMFSGGALYKTLGEGNRYYQMAARVLDENPEVIFLYAGAGDDSELRKLAARFEGRVVHIGERKDLFPLMEHIDVYLNTYPMIGGLMMQYAAMAGKVPVTLNDRHNADDSGILLDQEHSGVEFDSVDAAVTEINRLLRDSEYRRQRGDEIRKHVNSEENFGRMLKNILEGRAPAADAPCPDTTDFRRDYVYRFSEKQVTDVLLRRRNKILRGSFPLLRAGRLLYNLKKWLGR